MKPKSVIFILAFILLLDYVNNIPGEESRNISNEVSKNENEPIKTEKADNYILVLYGTKKSSIEYENGFASEKRNNISFIESGDFKFNATEKFSIKDGSEIKIHFSTSIISFERFFSSSFDLNVVNIESIDFSNFDLSLVTSFREAFNGCNSLKSIIFSNNISSILDLQYIFQHAISLLIIFLVFNLMNI